MNPVVSREKNWGPEIQTCACHDMYTKFMLPDANSVIWEE